MIFTFDPPETGWSVNGSADIIPLSGAPSPPNVLRLRYGLLAAPVAFRTLSGLIPGTIYPVYLRTHWYEQYPSTFGVRVSYNDTPPFLDAFQGENQVGWDVRFLGNLHYTFADRQLRIVGLNPANLGLVDVDTLYIGSVPPEFIWTKEDRPETAWVDGVPSDGIWTKETLPSPLWTPEPVSGGPWTKEGRPTTDWS